MTSLAVESSKFRVLVTDRFEIEAMALLKGDQNLNVTQSAAPRPTAEELKKVHALVIRSRTKIDADLLSHATDLKVIVTCTSGFDHIDLRLTEERQIKVMYTPNANAASACELTWGLVLACARKIVKAHQAVQIGEWSREALLGVQLHNKTYGVIGLGRIGSRVTQVAQAFGMRTIAFDPYREDDYFNLLGVQRRSLDELFKVADILSIHVPATNQTAGMITRKLLESANRHLLLVNSSRGSVLSERDLLDALNSGWIAGCGLDVFECEPLPPESRLLKMENVVLTPHIGATTHEAFKEASWEGAVKIRQFATSGKVEDPLPPQDLWRD